jgi:polysaccharide pyruvyl transferase WcaK-like protein
VKFNEQNIFMKKTLLVGSFGADNLGDELILLSVLSVYENNVVMTNNAKFSRDFTEKIFDIMPFPPTGLRSIFKFVFSRKYRENLFKYVSNIERVVFAGGGLFAIKLRAYFLWWIVFKWLQFILKKNVEFRFEYQGIDHAQNFLEKFILKSVFTKVDYISVRDEDSKSALIEVLSVKQFKNVEVLTDRVDKWLKTNLNVNSKKRFTDNDKVKVVQNLVVENEVKSRDILLLNARSFVNNDDYLKITKNYLDLKIIWVLFEKNDQKFVPSDFKGEVIFVKNYEKLFELFKKAKICIGERFHFLVLGNFFVKNRTYLLKSPYAKKVASFVKLNKIQEIKNLIK